MKRQKLRVKKNSKPLAEMLLIASLLLTVNHRRSPITKHQKGIFLKPLYLYTPTPFFELALTKKYAT
ncbi:hypothetical protein [Nostoc sp. 106C]|uniref:hypothetical protein n=1 Tax=Nostoc sp. 106C TaxID=1932667 RepID=UPI0011806D1A|nr:hypothetical protein [Nostoc sp. 106C]